MFTPDPLDNDEQGIHINQSTYILLLKIVVDSITISISITITISISINISISIIGLWAAAHDEVDSLLVLTTCTSTTWRSIKSLPDLFGNLFDVFLSSTVLYVTIPIIPIVSSVFCPHPIIIILLLVHCLTTTTTTRNMMTGFRRSLIQFSFKGGERKNNSTRY